MQELAITDIPRMGSATLEDDAPSANQGSLPRDGMPRRSFIRFVVGGAMGVGLATLGWLPPARPRGAWANCCLSEWTNGCHGFYTPSQTCYPANAKFTNNCTSAKWHRDDGGSGTCYNFKYTHYHSSCDGRNAWRWGRTRCSDGWYEYADCGGGRVSTFSICRATI